jgi:hypothetical protein
MRYWRFCLLLLLLPPRLFLGQQPPTTLVGDVVDATTGAPVPAARIKLTSKSGPLYTWADVRGHFQFSGNLAGYLSLSVDHPGFLPRDPIGVYAGGAAVRVPLTAGAIISGTVTDPNGLPAAGNNGAVYMQFFVKRPIGSRPKGSPGVYVMADGKSELASVPAGGIRVDDRGQYRSPILESGVYYVVAVAQRAPNFWDRTWRTTYYPNALDADSAKPIELSAGRQVRADIQMVRQGGVRVSGHLSVPSFQPPAPDGQIWTGVYLVPRGGQIRGPGATASITGDRFEALDLFPGTYTVVGETTSREGSGLKVKSLAGTYRQIEIGSREVTDLDLELQPLAEVTGKVSFPEGCPAAPVRVTIQSGSIMGVNQTYTTTGPDGAFAFGTFTPGPLSIIGAVFASAPGPATAPAAVWLGDRDITKSGFDYPTPTPQALRIVMNCGAGGGAR